jgi:hypothetical protein
VPAVSLGWPACGQLFELSHGFALGCHFLAEFAAGIGFVVESLRDRRRTARVAELQDFHLEDSAVVGDSQHVPDADFARRLGGLAVGLNPAELAGLCGEGACLEESGGPEPFVDADGGHDVFSYITS